MYLPAIKVLVLLIYLDISVFGAKCPTWMSLHGRDCLECPPGQSGPGCLTCSRGKYGPDCATDCHCESDCNPVTGECLDPSLGCDNINYNMSAYRCQLQYEPMDTMSGMARGSKKIRYNSTYIYHSQGPQAFDRDYSTVAYTYRVQTTLDRPTTLFVAGKFADVESLKRIRLIHFYLSEEEDFADDRGEFGIQFLVPVPGAPYKIVNCQYDKSIKAISHKAWNCPPLKADWVQIVRTLSNRVVINKIAAAEIEVFVCTPETYGTSCRYTCPLHCKNCNVILGKCMTGCDEKAWTGTYCNIFGLLEVSFPLSLYNSSMRLPIDMLLEVYISVSTPNSGSPRLSIYVSSPESTCDAMGGDWITLRDLNKTLYKVSYAYANYSKVLKFNIRFTTTNSNGVELRIVDQYMPHVPYVGATLYPLYIPEVQECLVLLDVIYADITLENPVGALLLVRYMDSNVTVTYSWNATYTGNEICPQMNVTHYEWNIATPSTVCWLAQTESIELPPGTNISQEVFVIPAFSLLHGVYEVGVNVHALSDTEEPFYRFTKRNIEIIQGPVVAALTGLSDRVHYWEEELVLNASLSYDKDLVLTHQVFNYSWSCILVTGEICVFNQSMPPSVNNTLPFTDPVYNLSSRALTVGSSYVFTVNVSYPGKGSSTASQTVFILRKEAPVLSIRCLENCGTILNIDENLALKVIDLSDPPFPDIEYTWSVNTSNLVSPEDLAAATTTGLNQETIVITDTGFMMCDKPCYSNVIIKGKSNLTEKIGFDKYLIFAKNVGPKGGNCFITPEYGFAVLTDFKVMCENFTDPELPLNYRLYRVEIDNTEKLLYSGSSSTMSSMELSPGERENYMVDLKMEIADALGEYTTVNISAKVLPPDAAATVDTNDTAVTDILYAVENRLKDFSVTDTQKNLNTESIQKLVTISTILNSESSTRNDTNSTRLERRQNVRAQIVTYLANSSIPDIDTLMQVADLTNDVLTVSTEVTETMQDKSVELFENLASSFRNVPKTLVSTTRKTAKTILHAISHTLKLQTVRVTEKENGGLPEDTDVVDEQTRKLKLKTNNKKMLSAVESVANTVTETVLVPELPLVIKGEDLTLSVTRSEGLGVADMKYSDDRTLGTDRRFAVSFTLPDADTFMDVLSEIKNSTTFVQLLIMDENPYVWDESYKNVTTPVMQLVIKNEDLTELAVKNLKQPIEIMLSTNREGNEMQTLTLAFLYDTETNRTVSRSGATNIVKVSIPHGSDDSLMIYIQPIDQNVTLLVYLSEKEEDITPDQTILSGIPIPHTYSNDNMANFLDKEQSLNMLIVNATALTTEILYMGITVMDDQTVDVNISAGVNNTISDSLSSDNMTIALGTISSSCLFYNTSKDKWVGDDCILSPFSSLDTLQCWCDHLSVIAGGFLVLPFFTRNIEIILGPVVAALTGLSDRVHYWEEELVLNASLSYDKDLVLTHQVFNYSWSCILVTGEICVFNQSMPPSVNNTLPFTDPVYNLSSHALTVGSSYVFTVNVSYPGKGSSTASQTVYILRKEAPVLSIRCLENCGTILNIDENLALKVIDLSDPPFPVIQYTWSVNTSNLVSPEDLAAATTTGLNQETIVITDTGFMMCDKPCYSNVIIKGISDLTEKIGFDKYLIFAKNVGPKGGNCFITPEYGFAVLTDFKVTCENFTDSELPLNYRLYRVEIDTTEKLLYSGSSSTMSSMELSPGERENYMVDLKVEIADALGEYTTVNISAKVLPPDAAATVDTNDTAVTDILYAVENRLKDFSVKDTQKNLNTESIQKLVTISTILNSESSTRNDTNSTRLERRQNVRAQIVTYLANSSIPDIDTLMQVADLTNDVLTVSTEVTETMQDKSVELFENLASSFRNVPKTLVSTTRKTAKTILHAISHTLKLQTVRVTEKENGGLPEDTDVVDEQTRKLNMLKLKTNNKKMLSAVESVANTVTETVLVPELPLVIKGEDLTLSVTRSEGLGVADMKYSDDRTLGTDQRFAVSFTLPDADTFMDVLSEIKNSTTFVQVLIMDENPYVWDESYKNVTTPVMQLVIKNEDLTELAVKNLKQPIEIMLSTNREGNEMQTLTLAFLYDPETNRTVSRSGTTNIVKVSIPHGSDDSLMIYIQPIDQNVTLLVYLSEKEEDITPDQTILSGIPIPHTYSNDYMANFLDKEQSLNMLIVNATALTTEILYMGITVMDDQTVDVNISAGVNNTISDSLSSDNMTIALGTISSSCLFYNTSKDKWVGDDCILSSFSSLDTLQCWCDHLSVIAGGFLVLPFFTRNIEIILGPVVAALTGLSDRVHYWEEELVLNASLSYDKDLVLTHQVFNYSWSCILVTGEMCVFNQSMPPCVNNTLPFTDPVYNLSSRALTVGSSYVFTVNVSYPGKGSSTASQTVYILRKEAPVLSIRCLENCGTILNIDENLALKVIDLSDPPFPDIQYTWSVNTSYLVSPEDLAAATTTGLNQETIVITDTGFMTCDKPCYSYVTIKGKSNLTEKIGFDKYLIFAKNVGPKGGNCFITPEYGFAVLTDFKVTCENFTDPELPLNYRLYRVEIDTTEKLLYSGSSSTMSSMELSPGERENYMVDLKVEIADALGEYTTVNISAKVLPPDAAATVDTNDTAVTDILYAVENRLKDFSVTDTQKNLNTESIQKLVTISTILNSESSTRNDTNSTRLERRQNVRAQIVTYLANSSIPDIDTLMQVADLTNDVLTVSTEVTETMQDKSVELFENLASSFRNVPKTLVSTTRKTAKTILHAISHTLKVQTVRVTEKEDGGLPEDTDVVDEQTQKLKLKTNNKKMLSAVESVVNTVTETVLVPELPLVIKGEDLTLSVTRSEGLGVADMKYSVYRTLGTDRRFAVSFTLPDADTFMDVLSEIKNSTTFVQVLIMDENPYVWDESYKNVTTPVMQLVIKNEDLTELAVKNLKQPIEIMLSTNREGNEMQTLTLAFLYDPETNRTVSRSGTTNIVKVSIPHGSDDSLMIYMQPIDQNVTLLVYLSEKEEDITPDQTILSGIPIPHTYSNDYMANFLDKEQSLNMLIVNATALTTEIFYMGITVMDDQTVDVNISAGVNNTISDSLSSDNMTIALGTISASCLFYNTSKDKWVGDDCILSPFSSMDTLQCWCDHLSVIAGGFLVLPYAIDPIADIRLFLTFFSNPVIVSTVIAIWFIYLVLLIWARRKDKIDFSKTGINVLYDNRPDEKYMYIIGVVTGWWIHAGTTANVYICLEGQDYHSDNRMLSDGSSKHFDTGNEDWFLMTTSICLGDLKSITVWHDNTGRDPTWFLKQILVQDMQTKETWHFIHNNWLGVFGDRVSKMIQIPAVTPGELAKRYYYQFSLRSSLGLQNNHLWISIVSGNENVNFTRAQRLSCALSLLLTTMLTSLMFHGIPTDDPADQLKTDVISFSWADLIIGVQSGLIMFPINLIMVLLFSKLAPKTEPKQISQAESGIDKNSQIKDVESFHWLSDQCSSKNRTQNTTTSKQKKKPFRFPWWFIYIAWVLVLCASVTSSYFVMLYGLKYGYKKSIDWLVSFFTAFFQSTCITQPLKVVIIAVLLSIIFKKPVEFENLSEREIPSLGKGEEYVQKDLLKKYRIELDSEPVPLHIKKPLSESQLKSVKEQLILESNMQMILRDLIVYIIYVFVVLCVVHGYRNINLCYYNTKTIEDIFIHESSYSGDVLFQEVSTVSDLWQYLSTTVIPNLVTGKGSPISGDMMYLLGTARLRQKRQMPGSCYFPPKMKFIFHDIDCVVSYTNLVDETRSFNKSWLHTTEPADPMSVDHWSYQTATQLKTLPYVGGFASYLGSGYVFELPLEKSLALQSLEALQKDEWIDKFTASLFVEFTLYNPNANLFSVVLLLFENTNIGTIFPKYDIFTAKLYHYTDGFEKFVAACEVIFVLVTFTMTIFEIKRYRRLKRRLYFSDPWNCVEILVLGLSYTAISLFIQQLVTVYLVLTEYQANGSNKFTSFSTAVFWDSILRYVLAALAVLVIVKLLKLFSFHNKTKILTTAIQTCWKPVLNVALIILICMIAFTHLGFFLFGRSLNDYHAFGTTILTLFNFILGVTDFYGLVEADRVNGVWFYFVFYSTMHYCLITVMIAVVMVSMKMSRCKLRNKQKSVFYYLFCHISNTLGLNNHKS